MSSSSEGQKVRVIINKWRKKNIILASWLMSQQIELASTKTPQRQVIKIHSYGAKKHSCYQKDSVYFRKYVFLVYTTTEQVLYAGSDSMQKHCSVEQSLENILSFKPRSSAAYSPQIQMLKALNLQSGRFIFVCWRTIKLLGSVWKHKWFCKHQQRTIERLKRPLKW